jgi:hypothetical protein
MKNKFVFSMCVSILFVNTNIAQQFVNGDLEGGTPGISALPPNWQNVPYDDVNCIATGIGDATPDLTGIDDISANAGIKGTPYSGSTFVSGLVGETFQEGIMQTLSGLEVGKTYTISLHQSVVKQDNALDKSGSWAVYFDTILASITQPTHSEAAYNSISFIWELRNITFTATASSHLIKFLPIDDDSIGTFSITNTSGALRMGIDAISLSSATGIKEYNQMLIPIYPNPANATFNIKLPTQQTFNLQVIDIAGRTAYTNKNATGNITVDCNSFGSGVYFVKAVNERVVLTGKVIKK